MIGRVGIRALACMLRVGCLIGTIMFRDDLVIQPGALRQGIGCGQREKQKGKLQDRQQRQTQYPQVRAVHAINR